MINDAVISDSSLRLSVFFVVLVLMLIWEQRRPRRLLSADRFKRWPQHLSLTFISSVLARLSLPIGLSGLALFTSEQEWGLFNSLSIHPIINLLVSLVLLDLIIYWQHRLFHTLPWLWRLHRMHHSDLDFDTTTALRFHPLEILLSLMVKAAAILLFGISAEAILIFEILLNGLALFNHGNVTLPAKLDSGLRRIIVTPDMHRVHHSIVIEESCCNYGFNLSCWDRLFGSYLADTYKGQQAMTFGLQGCQPQAQNTVLKLLLQPIQSFAHSKTGNASHES